MARELTIRCKIERPSEDGRLDGGTEGKKEEVETSRIVGFKDGQKKMRGWKPKGMQG